MYAIPGCGLAGRGCFCIAETNHCQAFWSPHIGALLPSGMIVQVKPLVPGRMVVDFPSGSSREIVAAAEMGAGAPASAAFTNSAVTRASAPGATWAESAAGMSQRAASEVGNTVLMRTSCVRRHRVGGGRVRRTIIVISAGRRWQVPPGDVHSALARRLSLTAPDR